MNTRRPTLILSFTLLVVMLGYGMVLPVIPFYIALPFFVGAGMAFIAFLLVIGILPATERRVTHVHAGGNL